MASSSALCPDVRRRSRQSGFTLIEIIVVVTILALIGSLVLTRQPWHSANFDTDATLRSLMNAMRLARSRAIAQDREVAVVTTPNGFSIDGTVPRTLPADQALSPSRVVFAPDGGSTGGTILLLAGQRRITVDVNWLTGRVRARETANP